MRELDETGWVLDLLREAGPEAVTLGELEVVGVRDPARALWELELAGHAVSRVFDRAEGGRTVTCVRLGAPPATQPVAAATEPAVGRGHQVPASSVATVRRPLVVAVLLLGVLIVLGRTRR